ncbi:MAG: FxsA family protein [Campylobacterales bacterium]
MGWLYFLTYLFLEILCSYFFMELFSPLGFFIETVITALLGASTLKESPLTLLSDLQRVLQGELRVEDAISIGLFRFLGALLLIIPGFFSDIIGFLMLFDLTGQLFAQLLFPPGPKNPIYPFSRKPKEPEIIDVEIIEEKKGR